MKLLTILFFILIGMSIAGCTEKVGYVENRESDEINTPEMQTTKPDVLQTESKLKNETSEYVESEPTNKTENKKEIEVKPRFFPERELVLRDSKASLRSTSDNLFIIYHESGDSIPVNYIKILVFRNGELLDELRFDADAKYFKGIHNRLKSSIIRKDVFEEGDEIIITEREDFNIKSGEILGVKIVDSKWNITLLDSFVQVW